MGNYEPGSVVPESGKYVCCFCGMADAFEGILGGSDLDVEGLSKHERTTRRFSEGDRFDECPSCGPATGWDLVESEGDDGSAAEPVKADVCPRCGGDLQLGPAERALIGAMNGEGQTAVQCRSCGESITYGGPLSLGDDETGVSTSQPAEASTSKRVERPTLLVFICSEGPEDADSPRSKKAAPKLPGDDELESTVRQYAGMPGAAVELYHPDDWSALPSIPLNVLGAALSKSAQGERLALTSSDQLTASVAKLAATILGKYREQVAAQMAPLGFEPFSEADREKIQPRQWVFASQGARATTADEVAYRTVFVVLMTPEGIGEIAGPARSGGGCATTALALVAAIGVVLNLLLR